ncbi:ABC transporter permease subunit [Plantactinospora soyae]|uniref:ABC-2 type transport system permease protein n=1 Tax=Plantactinospora soyae TaxID=1544732 RepID=A0A927M1F3_9ACTN|nr:ABC transporter permease subunit [Plantactinospora soyae]MBE1484961.1 ABC-2 type transport system permease protein [Plantactinospora soyae]
MTTLDTQQAARPTGVIHDIGYQRYAGSRLGRRHIFGALFLHGLRAAFGLGRTAKAKIFPWLLIGVVGVVAVVLTAIRAQTGEVVLGYAEFPEVLTVLIIFFSAVVAPELASRDLHSGVLPLYFARPLRRGDYALARLASLVCATFLLLAGPMTVMFVGAAFTLGEVGLVWSEFGDFVGALAYVAVHAVVFGAVALLISSLIRRRALAAGAIVGAFMLTTPVVVVLALMPNATANQLAGLASPVSLVSGLGDWVFESTGEAGIGGYGPLYAIVTVALVTGCVLLLLARYRKVAAK